MKVKTVRSIKDQEGMMMFCIRGTRCEPESFAHHSCQPLLCSMYYLLRIGQRGSQQSERTVKIRLQFAHFLCNGSAYLHIPYEATLPWKMKKVLTDIFSELAWNISEFQIGILITSCSFHFGVALEFPFCAVRHNFRKTQKSALI